MIVPWNSRLIPDFRAVTGLNNLHQLHPVSSNEVVNPVTIAIRLSEKGGSRTPPCRQAKSNISTNVWNLLQLVHNGEYINRRGGGSRTQGHNVTFSVWRDDSGTSGVSKRAAGGNNQPIGNAWKKKTDGM